MALTPVPTIDPALPIPPNPADEEAVFDAKAYAWSEALPGFGSDVKSIGDATYANAQWAETKASEAATSASDASTSETNAGDSASAAAGSASAANDSAVNALASEVAASKLNLGAKASPPTVDNQGATLLTGATYFDTTLSKWRVWSGSAWADGISAVAGVSSINGLTGEVTGVVDLTTTQTITNKTLSATTNNIEARSIRSATTTIDVSLSAAPAAGQVLTALSPTSAAWTSPVESGLVCLASASASTVAAVDFTSFIDSTYDAYIIHLLNIIPATNSVVLHMRTSVNGGESFDSGVSDYKYAMPGGYDVVDTADRIRSAGSAQVSLSNNMSNTAAYGGYTGIITLVKPSSTTSNKHMLIQGMSADNNGNIFATTGGAVRLSTSAINAVRFLFSSGNISSGVFKLYGVKKSV